jgi:alpha-galactosidase
MPYYGTGTGAVDPYMLRSVMCPHFTACFDMRRRDLDYALLRRVLGQWREFAPNYFGDYYPLTPYSLENTAWIAWQFDRPEAGQGVIQAFRRKESFYESIRVRLRGLEPGAKYAVTDLDRPGAREIAGRELMDSGLSIAIKDQPGSAVIVYRRAK